MFACRWLRGWVPCVAIEKCLPSREGEPQPLPYGTDRVALASHTIPWQTTRCPVIFQQLPSLLRFLTVPPPHPLTAPATRGNSSRLPAVRYAPPTGRVR